MGDLSKRSIAALLLLGLVGCSQAPPAYESHYTSSSVASSEQVVAIIGDSFTRGTELGGEGAQRWTAVAAELLSKQGVMIKPLVAADRGSGYVKTGSKGTTFGDQVSKVVTSGDDLVVLFGSVNDEKIPTDELTAAIQKTLTDVQAAAPQAKILMIGPAFPNPDPTAGVLHARDILKSEAEAYGAAWVDPIAERWFWDNPEDIGSDEMHPTNAGHRYLGEKIAPLIAQQLRRAG